MHHPLRLLLVPLLVLTACDGGGGNDDPDGGPPPVSDEAYFGLATGTCYRYLGGLAGVQDMTIGVEQEGNALGFTARQVRYRLGGVLLRTDYVTLEEGQVLIHRREMRGSTSEEVEFSPPLVWLERPVRETGTEPITTTSTATNVATTETATWTVEVSVAAPQSVTVPEHEAPYEAHPVFVAYARDDTGERAQDKLWMVPETGPVRVDLAGPNWPDMSLASVWTMEEGVTSCTYAP